MVFLQPIILWGLPLVLLPVLIHLLNRLRYRSMNWAAMMFLLRATRSSTRHSRIKQLLVLLCRMLAVLCLVMALSRPQVGGWLGLALGGPPDTVLMLLDRSASMEARDPNTHKSKRSHALELLIEAAASLGPSTRLVLIENAVRRPHEIATPALLEDLPLTRATDTAAEFPAMLKETVEYLIDNQTGRTEIWIASDLQQSNWQPDSARWRDLMAQLGSLPQPVKVRLLAAAAEDNGNLSLSLEEVQRYPRTGGSELSVRLRVNRHGNGKLVVPLHLELNGNPLPPRSLRLDGPTLELRHPIDLGKHKRGGSGRLWLPSDANLEDNTVFFVYGPQRTLRSTVVAETPGLRALLAFAAAPAPGAADQAADALAPDALDGLDLSQTSLLIWQGPFSDDPAVVTALQEFLAAGGVLVALPGLEEGPRILDGLGWGELEPAPEGAPYTVAHWDHAHGPLAHADAGEPLPVNMLLATRRRRIVADGEVLAGFADGAPFLTKVRRGAGEVYIYATLPDDDWSNLRQGSVLVPMLQRLLRAGGKRFDADRLAYCGQFRPRPEEPQWRPLAEEIELDFPYQAGLYRNADGMLALNRPPAEDGRAVVERDDLEALFAGVPFRFFREADQRRETLQSEIWRFFLGAILLALLAEAILTLPANSRGEAEPGVVTHG